MRQNPCDNREEFREGIQEVEDSFSKSWLDSGTDHPLQAVWHRKDIIACIELANLGFSLKKIKVVSPDQTRQNIKTIKEFDVGNMKNAIWEIILSSAFHDPPTQHSRLLGPRKPTYDIEIEFPGGAKNHISVKTYGQSNKDIEFCNKFNFIDDVIKENIAKSLQIFIFRDNYPCEQQWKILEEGLPEIVGSPHQPNNSIGDWTILIYPLTDDSVRIIANTQNARLYEKRNSYSLFMTIPFYKNENKNIEYKLKEACKNLIENGITETNNSMNSLMIHLPEYVSIDNYIDWCQSFFANNPEAPISYIMLIQPAFVSSLERDESFLSYIYNLIVKPGKYLQNKLHAEFPIGKPTTERLREILNTGFELPQLHYLRQSGNIFAFYGEISQGGTLEMRFNNGIIIHAIGKFRGKEFLLSEDFPPNSNLVLL